MNVIFEMGHPAHVHNFRHVIRALGRDGHNITIAAARKDVALALLDVYGLDYTILYDNLNPGMLSKMIMFVRGGIRLYLLARRSRPDLFVSRLSPVSGIVSRLSMRPHIGLDDTEHALLEHLLACPTTDVILTPDCYREELGNKQVRFDGYKELAYLHPSYYMPRTEVLETLGISPGERFIVVRLISWGASHDAGHHGIMDRQRIIRELGHYGRVLISSEGPVDEELKNYVVTVPPEQIHDLLYHASLFVGEGATMAAEAALLGTPSIYVSSLAGLMGNLEELEKKYGLIYSFNRDEMAISKAIELLKDPGSKKEWRDKKCRLYNEKIDVTAFLVWFIEHYPESREKMKDDPSVQYTFK